MLFMTMTLNPKRNRGVQVTEGQNSIKTGDWVGIEYILNKKDLKYLLYLVFFFC
jgi:hypothetical protein